MSKPDNTIPYASVDARSDSRLTLTSHGESLAVDLYSAEGLDLVAALWVKLSAEYRLMYEPRWLGIPIVQFAEDIVMMQELIWKVRPDCIVECGVAHGGSLILYASILELLGRGQVVGVDVEIRQHNRKAIEEHPLSPRVTLIEGSSVADTTMERVKESVGSAKSIMVILDSNHSRDHVLKELEIYSPLVTPQSYLVVMDGAQAHVWDIPRGKPEWRADNPLEAIDTFLKNHREFEVDPHYTRLRVTSNPAGFLKRVE